MRYQVPQFVDIEDKIVGPFTLKQFFMYFGGVLVLIPIYLAVDLSLFIVLAIPVFGIVVLFAHVRIHGKTLFSVIANAVNFYLSGQLFIWRRNDHPLWLKIIGEEYGNFATSAADIDLEANSLTARARALETEGNVINEDAEDPLLTEPK